MQTSQLDLRGIHAPEAISWWPPAVGWWLLLLVVVALAVFLYWIYQRWTRKTAVKMAKKLLVNIKNNREWDNAQKLCELSVLLRRVSISISPRNDVASLTGSAWLTFLDAPMKASPFSRGIGVHLADAPYRKQTPLSDADITQLINLCEDWLKHCEKPVRSRLTDQKKPS